MVKLLPCPSPQCHALGAMLRPSAAFPGGEPSLTGAYTPHYKCFRCGRSTTLKPAGYNMLPDLTLEDFDTLAKRHQAPQLARQPTKDLEGFGLTREQARDMYRAGIGLNEAIQLLRPGE